MNIRVQTSVTIERFCTKIRNALLNDDVYTLLDQCSFPLNVVVGGQTTVIEEPTAAEKIYDMFRMFYDDMGVARVEAQWVVPNRLSRDHAVIDVLWRLLDANGIMLAEHGTTYMLRCNIDGAKIVGLVLHPDTPLRRYNA